MKKLFIILAVVFGTQSYASAQWFGGYISPNVMCDPCVQASIAAANSAAWVSSIDMALMAQQMQMMAACPGGYVPSYNTSGWDSCSTTTSSTPVYESRYGDIDCHLCHGTGVCQTCNGKGWYYGFYGDPISCPNCHSSCKGKCGKCGGKGTVYGLK